MTSVAVVVTGTMRATGYSTRISSMITAYRKAGLVVDLFHFRFPDDQRPFDTVLDALNDYVEIDLSPVRKIDHVRPRPTVMSKIARARTRLPRSRPYQIVQSEMTNAWDAARHLDGDRRILVFHDDDWAKFKRVAAAAPDPARKALAYATAWRYRVAQRAALRQAHMCWFVSQAELDRVAGAKYRNKSLLVPNGADDSFFAVEPNPRSVPTVTFVGPPVYDVNARSIAWFLDNAWPHVVARRHDATLRLIGPGWKQWLGRPTEGIEAPGFVDDLPAELAGAHVVIAPLLAGGGTKVKMLEAMAAARPAVATTIAMEGLPRASGITVVDDGPSFAQAILDWFEDSAEAEEAARLNRAAVEDRKWSSIWERALKSLLPNA